MYFKYRSYLKFLLTTTNAHGVHSPFVFAYLTQGLYAPQKTAAHTATDILLKSIAYFKPKTLHLPQPASLAQRVKRHYPHLLWQAPCFDMMYTNQLSKKAFYSLRSAGKIHDASIILIPDIHQSPQRHQRWKALIAAPEVTVSLDLFHLGLVCSRKEQAKQHFTLRV